MPAPADISEQRFGRLVAKRPTSRRIANSVAWFCVCDCGKTREASVYSLRKYLTGRGGVGSCGCVVRANHCNRGQPAANRIDLTGGVFGDLRVTGSAGTKPYGSGRAVFQLWATACRYCGAKTTAPRLAQHLRKKVHGEYQARCPVRCPEADAARLDCDRRQLPGNP